MPWMRPTVLPLFSALLLAGASPAAADVEGKIQIGGQWLTQDSGIVSDRVPGSSDGKGGVVGSLSVFGEGHGRRSWGFGLDLEGNAADAGPATGVGVQTFGIVTFRLMAMMEIRLRAPRTGAEETFVPYALAGAGWGYHGVGEEIEYLGLPPPVGTPLHLDLDSSPAFRAGAGFHRKVTEQGLAINLEGGWKWDVGDFHMRLQGAPDREGRFNLSGAYALLGITLHM